MNEKSGGEKGNVVITARKSIAFDGIIDILTFDETGVTLSSELGMISLEGEDLHVRKMNIEAGEVLVDGKINGIMYVDHPSGRRGLFGRRK